MLLLADLAEENQDRSPPGDSVLQSIQSKSSLKRPLKARVLKTKTMSKKMPWTTAEKSAVQHFFLTNIRMNQVPGKAECEAAKSAEPELVNRTWQNIKFCVKNVITSKKN